jgi:[histone H3]-trimethyl-L-lysine4 demethylase
MPFDPVLNTRKKETEDDVEREFWKLVESLTETVEVEYGADIHSTTHGSGFPTVEKSPLNPYSKDPWNLNALPFHEESLFRHIKTDISGMTVPWLYVGMCFSTFCWHNEDHYTYSANYQHFGATKTWYGIPGADAHIFEEAMRQAVPELFETQPDLLFQLVTLLPPDQLRKAGVNVYALDQRAGQFVITFPQAYHAGFNHGFNFNEAVNFAPSDWEPFGEAGVQRLQEFRRQPCFSHDELLLTAAAVDTSIKTAKWLAPALERMRGRELQNRRYFWTKHQEVHPHDCSLEHSDEHEKEDQCNFQLRVEDEELQEEEYQCHVCKAYTFLSQFYCHHSSKVSCPLHVETSDCCMETSEQKLQGSNHTLRLRFSNDRLSEIVQKVIDKARVPEAWQEKLDRLLEDGPRPLLKSLHSLLAEGKKIPVELAGLKDLAVFVKRCDQWVEEADHYTTRKQQNRRKSEKTWKAKSNRSMKSEEKELTVEGLRKLLTMAEMLSFTHEKIEQLEDKSKAVDDWRAEAKIMLRNLHAHSAAEIEELLETGRGFFVTMQEIDQLDKQLVKSRWTEEAQEGRTHKARYTLAQCENLIKRGIEIEIRQDGADMAYFQDMVSKGKLWESKTKQVMAQENVNYGQLEALWAESQKQDFPVNPTTLAELDAVLIKNRAAKEQIQKLFDRTKAEDLRDRPTYDEVRNVMKSLEDWTSKPSGTVDLEREVKRHEDWMRKGKKLFGKANAPLHILKAHMETVETRNNYCFDLNDTFRAPVEPQSRDASPVDGLGRHGLGQDEKSVFCICRQPEGGMMIECEVCQDWCVMLLPLRHICAYVPRYHGKCLKIARGKVQRSETFTCPICDWRVKIPRDAARPKLEDLQQWADELPALPFQPEEEEILDRIIDKAQTFRDFLQPFITGNQICRTSEEMPTILFYLRKIEGSEVLLAYETNIFRQDVHKWQPIAPEPPPILEQSPSTRKPRPTKQQKMMKELGVEKVEDLPPHMRKQQMVRRKTSESQDGRPAPPPLQPAQLQRRGSGPNAQMARSDTPLGMPRQASTGNAPNGPGFEGGMSFGRGFGTSASSSYQSPRHTASPTMFSPTTSLPSNGGMRESILGSGYAGGPIASGPGADSSPALFSPGYGMGGDDDIRTGIVGVTSNGAGAVHHDGSASGAEGNGITEGPEIPSSPHPTNVDEIFMEMTNEDPDGHDEHVNEREDRDGGAPTVDVLNVTGAMSSLPLPGTMLDHQTSEASEALAMIGNGEEGREEANGANAANGGDEDGQGAFDEFLTEADA